MHIGGSSFKSPFLWASQSRESSLEKLGTMNFRDLVSANITSIKPRVAPPEVVTRIEGNSSE